MTQPTDPEPSEDVDDTKDSDAPDDEYEDSSQGPKPWDPAKIRITTKTFSLREIVLQIEQGELDLAPDFQRAFVWKERQRTRLIESIALGIPLPAFYFNQDKDGAFQVIDGVQRLTSVHRFFQNSHVLRTEDLGYTHDLAERKYGELDPVVRRRIANTQIVAHVIEPQTPDDVKYDIFYRVNTFGSPLTTQEIRHCMGRPKSREILKRLVERESFDKATANRFWEKDETGTWVRHNRRMLDRELALRFCAMKLTTIDEYRAYVSLDAFLLDFTRRLDGRSGANALSDEAIVALESAFDRAMVNAHAVLGKHAFRRAPPGGKPKGPINRAVFEAQAIALADFEPSEIATKYREIEQALRQLFKQQTYVEAVTVSTGDAEKIRLRLARTRQAVQQALA
jgi:hypothetical protein